MGQYYKGRKIGTCENMYYMRLDEAQKLARFGAKDDDGIQFRDYLNDDATRFRFPFPDEDDGVPSDCKFDKVFLVPAGGVEVGHDRIVLHSEHIGGGHGFNVFIPCLNSKEFSASGLEHSIGSVNQFLLVRYQAMRQGKEKTIFACARCGREQRFSDDDVAKIKEAAIDYYAGYDMTGKNEGYNGNQALYDYAMAVIDRIK